MGLAKIVGDGEEADPIRKMVGGGEEEGAHITTSRGRWREGWRRKEQAEEEEEGAISIMLGGG